MNIIENLHTAVRRYCIDRSFYWHEKYNELQSNEKDRSASDYSDKAYYIFSRYNVLGAILIEIERFRPEEFKTLDEARSFFKLVVNEAQSMFTDSPSSNIARMAMREEREALGKFIDDLTEQDLSAIEPLFYRRVLSNEESKLVRGKLQRRWEIPKHYWYPLAVEQPENVEAFLDDFFEKEIGANKLREILQKHAVNRIYEIREDMLDYEFELSVLDPYYNGAEGFWCDKNFDWVIYASHESSITIGGWLLAEIKKIWLNWEERIWKTAYFN